MSTIINPTNPSFSPENGLGGLDIQGFEDQENSLSGSDGDDLIIGGNRNDTLFGLGGNDRIEGLDGNDLIIGGAGADTLVGGAGNDTFQFDRNSILAGDGIDLIEDFTPGEDSLDIQGLDAGDIVDYDAESGIVSLNGSAFANVGSGLDFEELDFVFGDSDADNEVLSVDPDDIFSLDGGIVLDADNAGRIENFRNGISNFSNALGTSENADPAGDILGDSDSDLTQTQSELPDPDDEFGLL